MWLLTVASLMTSRAAISPLESPRATSSSVSRSRGVMLRERERGRGRGCGAGGGAGRDVLDQPARDRGREQRVACVDGADRVEQLRT